MTNYDKLVAALRYHADTTNCDACKLYDAGKCELKSCVLHDAADAIEALDAKADYWMGQAQEEYEKRLRQLPKRGEWVEENRRPRSSQFVCSECHRTAYDPQPTRDKAWRKRCRYAYCPNCGAKMREVQDG